MNNKYYLEKSQTSINDLIQDNLDLVKKIAWQLHGRVQNIVEVEDLIQQGMEGLIHAAQKYSPKEGVNFAQYAHLRIRGSIIDFLRKNSNLCRTTIKKKQEFERSRQNLEKKLNRQATEKELTDYLGISIDEFKDDLSFLKALISRSMTSFAIDLIFFFIKFSETKYHP